EVTGTNRPRAYETKVLRVHCAVSETAHTDIRIVPVWECVPGVCVGVFHRVTVVIATGKRPVPFRTRKLSLSAPMVLHSTGCGRVGHRRTPVTEGPQLLLGALGFEKGTRFSGSPFLVSVQRSAYARRYGT